MPLTRPTQPEPDERYEHHGGGINEEPTRDGRPRPDPALLQHAAAQGVARRLHRAST